MPNTVKYENQVWGEPIAGERLSTNACYTGEHKGTPTQDKLNPSMDAHVVELNTVHLGTVTQDAIEGSTPTVDAE